MSFKKKHIVIAITGASGSIYAKRLIERLKNIENISVSIILSDEGEKVAKYELGKSFIEGIPFKIYDNNDFFAPLASGSSVADALIVVPCTAGTLGKIASGIADNLICRAADVVLKERKRLILVLRESPYNLIHIKNMEKVTMAGGIICPATPSFYSKPKDINNLVDTIVYRILDLCEIQSDGFRWGIEK